jgi:hypothetical protein
MDDDESFSTLSLKAEEAKLLVVDHDDMNMMMTYPSILQQGQTDNKTQ